MPLDSVAEDLGSERTLRDLLGLICLPSVCHGRSASEVLEIVADTVRAAVQADVVYARLRGFQVDVCLPRGDDDDLARVRALADTVVDSRPTGPIRVTHPSRGEVSLVLLPLGFYAEAGHLLVGARDPAFPGRAAMALLQAATSLGTACLENARLLDAVRDADRRKEQFLALLGHELRNPLAPIVTALELMQMRHPACERERAIIERQTRHMIALVDDLLDISRVTQGKMELDRARVDVRDVVERGIELAAPLVERRGHTLTVDVPSAVVDADPLRLAQVFSNLLTNAARYTDPGGRIEVAGVRTLESVHVSVRDTGRGISTEKLHEIFEPFFQADRQKDALGGGLGLGLSLVRNLVSLHGGTVSAHSDGEGLGSTFELRLPLAAHPGARARRDPAS